MPHSNEYGVAQGPKKHPLIFYSSLKKTNQSKPPVSIPTVSLITKVKQSYTMVWSDIQHGYRIYSRFVKSNFRKVRIKLLPSVIPILTIFGYLLYRIYGVLRTFSN